MRKILPWLIALLALAAPARAQIGVPGQASPAQTMQVGGSNGGALFTVPGDGTNGFFVQVKTALPAGSNLIGGVNLFLGGTGVSIGQQLAAASIPVILPAATITTLTPPTTITANAGTGVFGMNLSQVGGSSFALGQQLAAASLPFVLTAAQLTTLTPPAAITGFATSTKQSDGSQKSQIVDGSGNVIASTSNNLNVQCANCSGAGASATDNATVTESTSTFGPMGAEFLTTPGTVTTGHQAMLSMTAHRSLFTSPADIGGTPTSDSTAHAIKVLSVDSTGTVIAPTTLATHDGALTPASTTGSLFMARASAAAPTNVSADDDAVLPWALKNGSLVVNLAASGALIGATSNALDVNIKSSGVASGGTSIADEAAFTQGTTTGTPAFGLFKTVYTACTTGQACAMQITSNGGLFTNLDKVQGTAIDVNSGNKSAGTMRVVLATDQPALTNKLLVTPDSVALPANQSVNISQINAVTPLMGNGVTGTGSPRVTIASDNTAFAVNATLSAETTKVIGTARLLGNAGGIVDQATGSAVPANALYSGINVAGNMRGWTGVNPSGSIFAGQVDLASIAGTTTLTGNGTAGAGAQRVTVASDNTAFAVLAAPTASATGGATPSNYISAASNNSTNLKASAGTLYSALVINNTATEKFVRFYDSASAPTCTSATGMVVYSPIPASTTGAGFVVPMPVGSNFANGIGWCITGAAGTTDNTSTAAGDVVMNLTYK